MIFGIFEVPVNGLGFLLGLVWFRIFNRFAFSVFLKLNFLKRLCVGFPSPKLLLF